MRLRSAPVRWDWPGCDRVYNRSPGSRWSATAEGVPALALATFLIGLLVGICIGVLIMAALVAAGRRG